MSAIFLRWKFPDLKRGSPSGRVHTPERGHDRRTPAEVSWKKVLVARAGVAYSRSSGSFFSRDRPLVFLASSTFDFRGPPISVGWASPFSRLIPNRRRRHRRCSRTPAPRRHQCDRQITDIDRRRRVVVGAWVILQRRHVRFCAKRTTFARFAGFEPNSDIRHAGVSSQWSAMSAASTVAE